MMSLRAVHAGNGYQYLLRSVATNDAYDQASETGKLAAYYDAKGTPPGRWIGGGIKGFNSETIVDGSVIEAEQMANLYGLGMHPDTDQLLELGVEFAHCKLGGKFPIYTNNIPVLNALREAENKITREEKRTLSDADRSQLAQTIGRKYYLEATGYPHASGEEIIAWVNDQKQQVRQAVAGFDLTFSPAKSVSILWALADEQTANRVAMCHHRAVEEALCFVETDVARTRRGAKGIAQVETKGIIAAEFTHFDTRAGDPDLHSHVLVSNKVQAKDGTWLALDGQPLFLHHQAISARYDAALHRLLDEELGLSMVENVREDGKEGIWEIEGVPTKLIESFSKRRSLARPIYDKYVAQYIDRHGRQPDKLTQKAMWQQAILDTRDAKKPAESLTTLRRDWEAEVFAMEGGAELLQQVRSIVDREDKSTQPPFFNDQSPVEVDSIARNILARVTSKRSYFGRHHLDTAASTVLKGFRFHNAEEQATARKMIVQTALDHAVALTPTEVLVLPPALIREDGKAVDRRLGSEKFTTQAILDAEENAMTAVVEPTVIFASNDLVDQALKHHSDKNGWSLNEGQAQLARHLLNVGTVAACGVGPAGTGKTTSMQIVTGVWQNMGRSVIGLAPSAAAAEVLGEEIGIDTTTIDQLTFTWCGRNPNRRGRCIKSLPIKISPGDMLLVDEAGMSTTENIAALCDIARESGAVVRFIGDPHQLDAVGNGGLFGAMCNAAPTAELTDVMRFSKGKDTKQAAASLLLRKGDAKAIDFYKDRGWVRGGSRTDMLTGAVDAYLTDLDRGRRSLVIASTNTDVDTINEMVREYRINAGEVDTSIEVVLAHDDAAGVGDIIIARKNKKFYTTTNSGQCACTGRVINGQMFTITAIANDGSLHVRDNTNGRSMVLPADYASAHCHLGYGSTIHRSQGATVDTTHAVIDGSTNRAGLYVALTRGAKENRVWAVTDLEVDKTAEDGHYHMAGNKTVPEAEDIIAQALTRDDRKKTAHETLTQEYTEASSTERKRALYHYACEMVADHFINATFEPFFNPLWSHEGTEKVRHIWKKMLLCGIDPREHMSWATADLRGSHDEGSVVAWRLQEMLSSAPAPVVSTPPPLLVSSDRDLDQWLQQIYAELTGAYTIKDTTPSDAVDYARHLLNHACRTLPPPVQSEEAIRGHSLVDLISNNDTSTVVSQPDTAPIPKHHLMDLVTGVHDLYQCLPMMMPGFSQEQSDGHHDDLEQE